MANFAQLNNSFVVLQVLAVSNEAIDNLPFPESEPIGIAFLQSLFGDETIWKQTSYNCNFRKNFPGGANYIYDSVLDAFIGPKPQQSWLLNTATCRWEAPVPYPTDGKAYRWNEPTVSWVETPAP